LPIILYNVPARSIVDMSVETVARLAKLPRIVAIKDCANDISRPVKTRVAVGPKFTQVTGDDPFLLPYLAQGGHGVISVTGNIAPKLVSDIYNSFKKGDLQTAAALNDRLQPVHDVMFCETNPGPVKYAASLLGLCGEKLRLPLWEVSAANKQKIQSVLEAAGLLAGSYGDQKAAAR
jgi:4-hydroxy-tetrahydrodipicolinate synthase